MVWEKGGDGGSGKKIPATVKSTKVSMNDDMMFGRFLQVSSEFIILGG